MIQLQEMEPSTAMVSFCDTDSSVSPGLSFLVAILLPSLLPSVDLSPVTVEAWSVSCNWWAVGLLEEHPLSFSLMPLFPLHSGRKYGLYLNFWIAVIFVQSCKDIFPLSPVFHCSCWVVTVRLPLSAKDFIILNPAGRVRSLLNRTLTWFRWHFRKTNMSAIHKTERSRERLRKNSYKPILTASWSGKKAEVRVAEPLGVRVRQTRRSLGVPAYEQVAFKHFPNYPLICNMG